MGRRERRRVQLLHDTNKKGGYWQSKEEVLDRNNWRTRFGKGYGPVVRRTVGLSTDRFYLRCPIEGR